VPRVLVLVRWLRLPLAPTAACDAAACLLLALQANRTFTARDNRVSADALGWLAIAGTSMLIYAFGMGLNDWADRRRDRTLAPTRPIPSGQLSPALALALVILIGSAAASLGAAAAYNLLLKRWLVPGAFAMGAVRAANALVGVAPLVWTGYGSVNHVPLAVVLAPLLVGLYAAAVSVLSTTEEVDSSARRTAARLMAATAFAGAAALAMWAAGRVTLGSVIAAGTVFSLLFARVPRPGHPKRQVLEMLLGLYLLAAVIAGGSGVWQVEIGALVVAFALVYLTQIVIRALARAAARGT
jgi:4-hydroxybenzoate polyprenyltransferase